MSALCRFWRVPTPQTPPEAARAVCQAVIPSVGSPPCTVLAARRGEQRAEVSAGCSCGPACSPAHGSGKQPCPPSALLPAGRPGERSSSLTPGTLSRPGAQPGATCTQPRPQHSAARSTSWQRLQGRTPGVEGKGHRNLYERGSPRRAEPSRLCSNLRAGGLGPWSSPQGAQPAAASPRACRWRGCAGPREKGSTWQGISPGQTQGASGHTR